MTLDPDLSMLVYSEDNVKPPGGLSPRAAYDAALYVAKSGKPKGVLVITMVLQYRFEDGKSTRPETQGQTLTWTDDEKKTFAEGFKIMCYQVWNNCFRITNPRALSDVNDVGVELVIQNVVDKFTINNHWRITVTKVDAQRTSYINDWTGQATLDSRDLMKELKPQRGAVHEFGHLLGNRDEYKKPDGSTPGTDAWTGETDSIMHTGESVKERHYALFAAWLSQQSGQLGTSDDFKVSGKWNVDNSHL